MKREWTKRKALGWASILTFLLGVGNASAQVECDHKDQTIRDSYFKLMAGGTNSKSPYATAYLVATFRYCKTGIAGINIRQTGGLGPVEKFKMIESLIRYQGKELTKEEVDKFSEHVTDPDVLLWKSFSPDDEDYEPVDSHEAFVIIKWKYYDNTRRPEHVDMDAPEARYTDRDSGNSVIRINTSNPDQPTVEVVRHGGYQWGLSWKHPASERSGLYELEPVAIPTPTTR